MRVSFANVLLAWLLYACNPQVGVAQYGGEGGGYDPCVPIEACFPPSDPPVLSGTGHSSTGTYTLTWAGYGATEIWESVNGGNWTVTQLDWESPEFTNQYYSFSGKPPGTYAYMARMCLFSCSIHSNTITVSVTQAPPPPPAIPAVSISPMAVSNNVNITGSFTVSWTQPSGWTHFLIREHASAWGAWEGVSTLSRSYTRPNGTYYYQVRACNDSGCSGESNAPYVVVDVPPGVPSNLQANPQLPNVSYTGDFSLTWTGSGPVEWYEILRSRSGSSYEVVKAVSAATTSTSLHFEENGVHSVSVRACTSRGCSELARSVGVVYQQMQNLVAAKTIAPPSAAGSIPHSIEVGHTGESIIRVPVSTSPGINGLQPTLALQYSSGATRSNSDARRVQGSLGYGWSLAGLSEFRFCHAGLAHTQQAVWCLDGDPIILVSGTAATDGAEYRLERRPEVRVIERWTTSHQHFLEVYFPDGTRGVYGGGGSETFTTHSLLLTSLTDAFGNQVIFSYFRPPNGTNYLTRIAYGGHQIDFFYEIRSDTTEQFGNLQTVALNRIAVAASGSLVREYRLENTKAGSGATDPLRLGRIQLCAYEEGGYGEQCLAPLMASWAHVPGAPADYAHAVASVLDGTAVVAEFDYELLPAFGPHSRSYTEEPFGPLINESTANGNSLSIPTLVVTQMRTSDGIGGWRRTSFAYKGIPLYNTLNRGLIGFAERRITEHAVPDYSTAGALITRNVTTYVQHRLDFPHTGSVTQRLTVLDGDLVNLSQRISHEENLHAHVTTFGGRVYASFVSRSMTRGYESGAVVSASVTTQSLCYRPLSGDSCPTSGTTTVFPTQRTIVRTTSNNLTSPTFTPTYWGQVPARATSGNRGSQTTVVNLSNDSGAWILGFPAKIRTTHVGAGAASVTRTETRDRYAGTPATDTLVRLPGTLHELTTAFGYDAVGNVTSVSLSGPGMSTQSTSLNSFLSNRYPQYVINPELQQTFLDYDTRFGTVRAATDPNGRTRLITRDPFGRIASHSAKDGTESVLTYQPCLSSTCSQFRAVQLITRSAVNGSAQVQPTQYIYLDALGREVLTEVEAFSAADGMIRTEMRYDAHGRKTHQSVPYLSIGGSATYAEFYHDVRGRLVREAQPDGGVTTTRYAGSAGTLSVTSTETVIIPGTTSATRIKRSNFDARGLMTSTVDASGQTASVTTAYVYDALGNLANVTVGGVQISAMRFNAAGYREQITEVNTGLTTFVTDPLGRVKSQSDARGLTTQFNYDRLNRMTSRIDDYGGSSPVTNTWNWDAPNAIGALEYKSSPGIREDYTYDALGRVTHQHSAINVTGFPANGTYTTQFGYDAQGRTASVTYAGHGAFTHHYTSRGYMEELRQGSAVLERITQHDAFGRPDHIRLGNGLETDYQHDLLGRINRITTGSASAPRVTQDLEYEWRSNGMLRARRDYHNGAATAWGESFAYDNLDRVYRSTTTGIGANRVLNYSYDTLGNLLTKTSSVAGDLNATNHSDGSAHRLSGATIAGIYTTFSYDPAGNIVQYLPASGPSTQLGYNSAGQVSSITVGASAAPDAQDQFWYGPDGDRFMKRVTWRENGVARTGWSLYLLGGAYEHSRIVGDTTTAYRSEVQVSGTVVHRRTQLVNGTSTTAIQYRHRDHLGSTDVITNSAGAIVSSLAFDPFGARRAANWTRDMSSSEVASLLQSSSPAVQRGFTDHEHLDRTGFIHMNGRVYDSRTARFVQPDPIVQVPGFSQSYNRYAYTFNSPMSFTDPSGYQSSDIDTMPGDNYNSCSSLAFCFVLDPWTERTWRAPIYESSGAQEWGQYVYDTWINSTIPGLRSEHRVAGGGVDAVRDYIGNIHTSLEHAAFGLVPRSVFEFADPFSPVVDALEATAEGEYGGAVLAVGGVLFKPAKAAPHMHHLLPQAKRFQQFFKRAGLDIEAFKIPLDKARHTLKPDGIHTNSGGNWNKVWDGFFQVNPNATQREILDQLARMRRDFGI